MGELQFKPVAPAKVHGRYRVRVTLLTDALGTKPCSADIATRYLQQRMTKADRMARDLTEEDRIAAANEKVEQAEKAMTIFYKDDEGRPVIQGFQIMGFLKEAAITQSNDRTKLASNFYAGSLKTRIEQAYNVPDYWIRIRLPDGYDPYETVKGADGGDVRRWKVFERPLRSEVRGVQMTSIAKSEVIPAGSTLEFDVEIRSETVPVSSGKQSAKVDAYDLLIELLGEGQRRGLMQFRNAGYGRFRAEIAEL